MRINWNSVNDSIKTCLTNTPGINKDHLFHEIVDKYFIQEVDYDKVDVMIAKHGK